MEIDEAKKALEDEKKARTEECNKEIFSCLQKHNCALDVALILKPGVHPQPFIQVVSK